MKEKKEKAKEFGFQSNLKPEKEKKRTLMDDMNDLRLGNLEKVKSSQIFVLLRWFSGSLKNLEICSKVAYYFFSINHDILKRMLFLGVDKNETFIKYPKKSKDTDKIKVIKKYLKKYYGWSDREFYLNIVEVKRFLENKEKLNEFAIKCALDKKESKILEIEYKTFKKPKVMKDQMDLFSDF